MKLLLSHYPHRLFMALNTDVTSELLDVGTFFMVIVYSIIDLKNILRVTLIL